MIACDEVREKLPDYLYELLPDWQMEEIASHTAGCEACRELAESAAREFRLLDSWEAPGPAGDTTAEFMRRLRLHQTADLARPDPSVSVVGIRRGGGLARLSDLIERFRAMPTGAKLAVSGVSLAAVVALVFALVALSSRRSGVAQQPGPKVIEGVPRLGYQTGRHTPYIAALHAVLQSLGSPMTYEELMVASGAAFATAWRGGYYEYDSRVLAPEDVVRNGAIAAGGMSIRRNFQTLDEAWEAVRQSLDDGRPVIAARRSIAYVICGYDPQDRTVYVQHPENASADYEQRPFEGSEGVYGGPNEFIFVKYDPADPAPEMDWPGVLARAVRFDQWPFYVRADQFDAGRAAYDMWAATLRRGVSENGAASDVRVTVTMAAVMADRRACAQAVLTDYGTLDQRLVEAAGHYGAEVKLWQQMRGVLAQGKQGQSSEVMKAAQEGFMQQAVREQAARLVEQARDEDKAAVNVLPDLLQEWSPEVYESLAKELKWQRAPITPGGER
jgi:hypothetical protein